MVSSNGPCVQDWTIGVSSNLAEPPNMRSPAVTTIVTGVTPVTIKPLYVANIDHVPFSLTVIGFLTKVELGISIRALSLFKLV